MPKLFVFCVLSLIFIFPSKLVATEINFPTQKDGPIDINYPTLQNGKVTLYRANVVFESPAPLAVHSRQDGNVNEIFVGGTPSDEASSQYRKKIAEGAKAAEIVGAQSIYSLSFQGAWERIPRDKLSLELSMSGTHITEPAPVKPLGSTDILVFFTRVENVIAETCYKTGKKLESCNEYLNAREIGLASYDGERWASQGTVIAAGESGDGSGAGMPAAVMNETEIWLYYSTSKQDPTQASLFRQRLGLDGLTKLGPPERLRFEKTTSERSLEKVDLVRLKCNNDGKIQVITMVASTKERKALPFFVSYDGLKFRQAADSIAAYTGNPLTAPTQLPSTASPEECNKREEKHDTRRDVLFSEQATSGAWQLIHSSVSISLP